MNEPQRDSESILKNLAGLSLVILINCFLLKKVGTWVQLL